MKKTAFLLSLLLLAGCSSNKESDKVFKMRLENELVNACMDMTKKGSAEKYYSISTLRELCNCNAKKVIQENSLDDLRKAEESSSFHSASSIIEKSFETCMKEQGIKTVNQ